MTDTFIMNVNMADNDETDLQQVGTSSIHTDYRVLMKKMTQKICRQLYQVSTCLFYTFIKTLLNIVFIENIHQVNINQCKSDFPLPEHLKSVNHLPSTTSTPPQSSVNQYYLKSFLKGTFATEENCVGLSGCHINGQSKHVL